MKKILCKLMNEDPNDPLALPFKPWEKVVCAVVGVLLVGAVLTFWHIHDVAAHKAYGQRYAEEVKAQK